MRRVQTALAATVLGLALLTAPAMAGDDLIRIKSPHSVAETLDNLAAAIKGAGAAVFGRINHAGSAHGIGMEFPDNEVLVFGNPKIGSPAIRDAPTMGLDLPLKAMAFEDADGQVWLVYRNPADAGGAHGLPADHPSIKKMTGALAKLTAAAVK